MKAWRSSAIDPFEPAASLRLVIDALEGLSVLTPLHNASRKIGWCEAYFPQKLRQSLLDIPDEQILVVARVSAAAVALQAHPQAVIAVVLTASETKKAQSDITAVVPTDVLEASERLLVLAQDSADLPLEYVVSCAQSRIQHMQGWRMAMRMAAVSENPLAQLLDLGEQIFGNFIHVSDGSYALRGYTHHIAPSSQLNDALIRQGYHDAATIGVARREGIFGQWEKQIGIKVFQPTDQIPYTFMTYVIKRNDQYCGHVVMECNHVAATALQVSLFDMFAHACARALLDEMNVVIDEHSHQHEFLVRLIDDPRCTQAFVNNQSVLTGIPAEGTFRLVAFDVGGTDLENQYPFLISSLVHDFPYAYVFQYENSVLALVPETHLEVTQGENLLEMLSRFCSTHECLAYYSDEFSRVRDIRLAYQQVKAIARYRLCVDIWKRPMDDLPTRRVFTADDAFAYICYSNDTDQELKDFCIGHTALERLMMSRQEGSVGDLRFLHCYLFNERRTGPTAFQLGLHRNSIAYRARCLKERYGIDLDQAAVRERMLVCLKLKIANDPSFADALAGSYD